MRVTVGTCYYGPYDRDFFQCVAKLNETHPEIKTVGVYDCSYIDQAKSTLATKHMDDSDVVIIVDHDMIFEPDAIVTLAESAMEADAVVGAAYCTRSQGQGTIAGFADPPVTFFRGGGRVLATALAGGFLAIPTRVLKSMAAGMDLCQTSQNAMAYPFFACKVDMANGKWWGEDLSFCWRLDEMGEEKFIDTRIRVGHKGKYIFHIEDALISVPRMDTLPIGEKK